MGADSRFAHGGEGFRRQKERQSLIKRVGFVHLGCQPLQFLGVLGRRGLLCLADQLLALL